MTKLYLLDTNLASYVIKGSVPAVQRHIGRVPMAQLAISAVTEGELLYGVARRPEATRLHAIVKEFLLRVSIAPWDSDVARHYGTLRAAFERQGRPIGNLDMMIGAHALALGAVLVTNDQAFSRIKGLKIENWAE
jgi:tRNA(fMet)-specific endonuclease VapC